MKFEIGQDVSAGQPYTEDYDEGTLIDLTKGVAKVRWHGSGEVNYIPVELLRDGWDNAWMTEDDEFYKNSERIY